MTTIGRRTFLGGALAAAVSGVAVLNRSSVLDAAAAFTRVAAPAIGLDDTRAPVPLERTEFAPHVGAGFSLVGTGKTVVTTLAEIADVKGAAPGDPHRFSLVLEARAGDVLPQGSYTVRSRALGDQLLFVVPVDRGVKKQIYQITVNSPAR